MINLSHLLKNDVVITANAVDLLDNIDVAIAIRKFISGDWGDMPEADVESNNYSAKHKGFQMGCYYSNGTRFWIITDPGHQCTTVLLPEEY